MSSREVEEKEGEMANVKNLSRMVSLKEASNVEQYGYDHSSRELKKIKGKNLQHIDRLL